MPLPSFLQEPCVHVLRERKGAFQDGGDDLEKPTFSSDLIAPTTAEPWLFGPHLAV